MLELYTQNKHRKDEYRIKQKTDVKEQNVGEINKVFLALNYCSSTPKYSYFTKRI